MQTYKRAFVTMLVGFIAAPVAGIGAVIICSFFISDQIALGAIGAIAFMMILLLTIFGERVTFTISADGQFSYYKRKKRKHQFDLKRCQVGYSLKSSDSIEYNIRLRILPEGQTETVDIDASPLGWRRFEKMFKQMESLSLNHQESE